MLPEKPSKQRLPLSALHLAFISVLYIAYLYPLLSDASILPAHDDLSYHVANYVYNASSLSFGYGLALWDPSFGGVPIGVTSINMFPFVPHRLVGYLMYAVLPLDVITLYKCTLALGMLVTVLGWWLVLFRLWGSRAAASAGCLMLLLGGTGFTIFHQEQVLTTMFLVPWTLLALLAVRDDVEYLPVLAVLVGFSMTVHYPQIHLLALLFLLLAMAVTGRVRLGLLKEILRRRLLLAASLLLFIAAASPAFYINSIKNDFSSPLRDSVSISPETLMEYVAINRQQLSAASFAYIRNYVMPETDVMDDQYLAYVTVTGLALAALGVVFGFRRALPVLIVFTLCVWAALGIDGGLAQVLFSVRFPFIAYFRQWYHFLPFANLCLSALGALGASVIIGRLVSGRRLGAAMASALLIPLAIVMIFESRGYYNAYVNGKMIKAYVNTDKPTEAEMFWLLDTGMYTWEFNRYRLGVNFKMKPLIVYEEWYRMNLLCVKALSRSPFMADIVLNTAGSQEKFMGFLDSFCAQDLQNYAVMADLPVSESGEPEVSLPNEVYMGEGFSTAMINAAPMGNYNFSDSAFVVRPDGARLEGFAPRRGLVVLPFAYGLGLKARVNGGRADTHPVYGGASTGVVVPAGRFSVFLSVPFSRYQAALIVQGVLLVLIACYPLLVHYKAGRPKKSDEHS